MGFQIRGIGISYNKTLSGRAGHTYRYINIYIYIYIILQNNTKLTIKNISITNCGFENPSATFYDYDICIVYLDLCKDVVIENLSIVLANSHDCFASVNTFGHLVFKNVIIVHNY